MFIHQVYFWLKNPDSKEDHARLLEGIQSLSAIEPKTMFHVGIPATTSRGVIDTTYSFAELITFNNLKEHDSYQVHPIHLKFIEDCAHLWSKVVIYDSVAP